MKRYMIAAVPLLAAIFSADARAQEAVTINPTGTILARGVAVSLSGTLECPAGEIRQIDVQLRQAFRGSDVNSGLASTHLTCTGSSQTWSLTLESQRTFKPGSAYVFATLYDFDACCTRLASAERSVKLVK
jgi:uncharacterized protein DUF6299